MAVSSRSKTRTIGWSGRGRLWWLACAWSPSCGEYWYWEKLHMYGFPRSMRLVYCARGMASTAKERLSLRTRMKIVFSSHVSAPISRQRQERVPWINDSRNMNFHYIFGKALVQSVGPYVDQFFFEKHLVRNRQHLLTLHALGKNKQRVLKTDLECEVNVL